MPSRSHSALEERNAVLLDIGRTLAGALRPGDLYHTLWRQASRVVEAQAFFVARYDADADVATVVFHAVGDQVLPEEGVRYPGAESRAIRERRPVLQPYDDSERRRREPSPGRAGPRSGMVAPVLRGEKVLGAIGVQSEAADSYGTVDLELFAAIADLAAVALENALYVEQLELRRREAERLEEIGRAITGSLELPRVLDRVARAALDLLEADGAIVWLVHEDDTVEVAMTAGRTLFPLGLVFQGDPEMIARIRRAPRRTFGNVEDFPLAPPNYRGAVQAGSSVGVLLSAETGFIGALSVRHTAPRRYSEGDVQLLSRIADQATIAVTNARMHERMQALSLTDPLTQLPNRRHLEMFLGKEFAAARRGRRLAVVLYDLDNFKAYNDSAGHQAGDVALRAFAGILARNTRAMNLTARYGGDEFVTVLTDIDRRGTLRHVDRICSLVQNDPLLGPAGIRASAGIAIFGSHIPSTEALLLAADRNMCRRKARRKPGTRPD